MLEDYSATWTEKNEPSALEKALEALKALGTRTLPALDWNEGLNLAAKDHCDDLGPKGLFGHFGTNESSPFDRISNYGTPGWWRGENLSFNEEKIPTDPEEVDNQAKKIVMRLFIDEGLAGRPSRHRMLNPEFKLVGIHTCPHREDGSKSMSVIDYAGSLETNQNTANGVLAAQKKNKEDEANNPDPTSPAGRCSTLPDNVVTTADCEIFNITNEIRKNPKSFLAALESRLKDFEAAGVNLEAARTPTPLAVAQRTVDNLYATQRAIAALKRLQPVPELAFSDALFLSAFDHCQD